MYYICIIIYVLLFFVIIKGVVLLK